MGSKILPQLLEQATKLLEEARKPSQSGKQMDYQRAESMQPMSVLAELGLGLHELVSRL